MGLLLLDVFKVSEANASFDRIMLTAHRRHAGVQLRQYVPIVAASAIDPSQIAQQKTLSTTTVVRLGISRKSTVVLRLILNCQKGLRRV